METCFRVTVMLSENEAHEWLSQTAMKRVPAMDGNKFICGLPEYWLDPPAEPEYCVLSDPPEDPKLPEAPDGPEAPDDPELADESELPADPELP